MGDQGNQESDSGSSITYRSPGQQKILQQVAQSPDRNEQVRSRWTPKPEQILILESIFNSGMVNPPKDETIKIRRLLERFGPVGDANVFYWFQNRRSRSRRRQRQMQASYMEANARNVQNASHYYDPSSNLYNPSDNIIMPNASEFTGMSSSSNAAVAGGASLLPPFSIPTNSSETFCGSASSYSPSTALAAGFDGNGGVDSYFSEMGFKEEVEGNGSQAIAPPYDLCASDGTTPDSHFQPPGGGGEGGFVTVFLNGVPTEVPSGPLDMKAMCGQDFLLVHSSGQPVLINEYGFSAHSLQHGESYFLVAKSI